ncbi:MAG: signal recognition particle-docking protein FtsY [Acidobacteriota bacterium]
MSIFSYQDQPGYFRRLKEALKATKDEINHQMNQVMGPGDSPLTESQIESLEDVLIGADIGVQTSLAILERVREETRGRSVLSRDQVRGMIRNQVLEIFQASRQENPGQVPTSRPQVVFVVGVNGVGKTTTVGKLAHLFRQEGKEVLVCAADTFRAAAAEQLTIWAQRTGSDIVQQGAGADPTAVLFDAMAAARARNTDVLVVDTAGRLHTKTHLMDEVQKMKRLAAREMEGAPHQVYWVLDATTGQNGLNQAREFFKQIGITGVVVAKLDGTAKGGIVVAIARELKIPIRYVGIGEQAEDLIPFSAEAFVDSLGL